MVQTCSDPNVRSAWAQTTYIWKDRTQLKVKFLNIIPSSCGYNTDNIIEWANRWRHNEKVPPGEENVIPEFVEDKEVGDIRVWFFGKNLIL